MGGHTVNRGNGKGGAHLHKSRNIEWERACKLLHNWWDCLKYAEVQKGQKAPKRYKKIKKVKKVQKAPKNSKKIQKGPDFLFSKAHLIYAHMDSATFFHVFPILTEGGGLQEG